MKYYKLLIIAVGALLFVSCEKDNLDEPDATFFGEIRDRKTGDLVLQEINDGSKIYYIEQGWANPQVQELVIKNDGTFRNNLMFSGNYKVVLTRGNYVPMDTIVLDIKKGNNYRIFEVTPYVRILDPKITIEGNEVVARFRLEHVAGSTIYKVGLFAHSHENVSNSLKLVENILEINDFVIDSQEFKLTLDLSNTEVSEKLKSGKSYYFRIGALSHGSETKFNYTAAVQMTI